MSTHRQESALVRATRRLEESTATDPVVSRLELAAYALLSSSRRRELLQGDWLGHALHPLMTDLPVGFWTSSMVLDLAGGRQMRPASQRLVGLGLASAVPTAVTGLAEWGSAGQREQRVGVVHAAANAVGVGLYAASYRARRRRQHVRGVLFGLAGGTAATVGGYLGGHLASARKVGSRHPAFEDDRMALTD